MSTRSGFTRLAAALGLVAHAHAAHAQSVDRAERDMDAGSGALSTGFVLERHPGWGVGLEGQDRLAPAWRREFLVLGGGTGATTGTTPIGGVSLSMVITAGFELAGGGPAER